MDVSVIIVNYKTPGLAARAISSVLKQKKCHHEILVVDNASQDNSINLLREQFGEKIHLIENTENLGFGRANNIAFEKSHGEYIYLLNPDAELESEYSLANLIEFARHNKQFGLIGTAIFESNKNRWVKPRKTYPAEQYLKYTTTLKKLPGQWAWVLGASMLISRTIYQSVSGFDPDYFLYGEETDLCLRIRQTGFAIGFCESVKVKHVGGASENKAVPKETWLRKQRGLYLFYQKHYHVRDVKRIAKKQLRRIRWKLSLVKLKGLIGKNIEAKLQRLKASAEIAKQYI